MVNFTLYDVEVETSLENALEIAYLAARWNIPSEFDNLKYVDRVAPVFNFSGLVLDDSDAIDDAESCLHVAFTYISDNETSNYTAEELARKSLILFGSSHQCCNSDSLYDFWC